MVSIDESNHFVGFLCYKQTDEMNENFNIKSTKRIIVFTANSFSLDVYSLEKSSYISRYFTKHFSKWLNDCIEFPA